MFVVKCEISYLDINVFIFSFITYWHHVASTKQPLLLNEGTSALCWNGEITDPIGWHVLVQPGIRGTVFVRSTFIPSLLLMCYGRTYINKFSRVSVVVGNASNSQKTSTYCHVPEAVGTLSVIQQYATWLSKPKLQVRFYISLYQQCVWLHSSYYSFCITYQHVFLLLVVSQSRSIGDESTEE